MTLAAAAAALWLLAGIALGVVIGRGIAREDAREPFDLDARG